MLARLSFAAAIASIALSSTLTGAPAGATAPAPPQKPAIVAVSAAQIQEALSTSTTLFKNGDFAGGEAALSSVNLHAAGTAEGSRDAGQALAMMACRFRQNGDAVTASKLAQAALVQLQEAQLQVSGNSKLAASIDTLIGFVQEHLCGAPQQAESSYQAAVKASPTAAKTAAAALSRLQAGDAFLAQRTAKTGAN